jgi:Mg-chelatase subunit ChlI
MDTSGDLLIVGPGRLGLLIAGLWRQEDSRESSQEASQESSQESSQETGQESSQESSQEAMKKASKRAHVYLKFRTENPERTRDMERQGYTIISPDSKDIR